MPTASNRINFTWADSSTKYWDVSSRDGDTLYFVENDGIYIGARKVADNLFFNKEIILEPVSTEYFPSSTMASTQIPVQWDSKKYGYTNGSTIYSTELVYLNNKNVLSNGQIFTLLFNNIKFRGLTTLGANGAIQLRVSAIAASGFSSSYYSVYKNYNEYLYPTDIIEFGSTVDNAAYTFVESIKLVYLEFPRRTGAFYLLGKLPIPSGKVIPGKSGTRRVVDYDWGTYALAMETGEPGKISPLATSSSVNTTNKTKNPIGFLPGGKIYLNLGPALTSGTYINGTNANKWNIYTELSNSAFNFKYSSNCGDNLIPGKHVYIIFNEGDDGRWYLDDTWWDTSIRAGKICVPIGISTSLAGYTGGIGYIENFCGTNRALTCTADGTISEFVSNKNNNVIIDVSISGTDYDHIFIGTNLDTTNAGIIITGCALNPEKIPSAVSVLKNGGTAYCRIYAYESNMLIEKDLIPLYIRDFSYTIEDTNPILIGGLTYPLQNTSPGVNINMIMYPEDPNGTILISVPRDLAASIAQHSEKWMVIQ